MPAASRSLMFAGVADTSAAGILQNCWNVEESLVPMIPWKNTRSPALNCVTLLPTATITPAASEPRIAGYDWRKASWSRIFQSTGLIAVAVILIPTSSGWRAEVSERSRMVLCDFGERTVAARKFGGRDILESALEVGEAIVFEVMGIVGLRVWSCRARAEKVR
jgi:hypothetical protein